MNKESPKKTMSKKNIANSKPDFKKGYKKHKPNNSSDDDSSDFIDDSDEEEEFDVHEYRKTLATLFPSRYLKSKCAAGSRLKRVLGEKSKKRRQIIESESGESGESEWEDAGESDEAESDETDEKPCRYNTRQSRRKVVVKNRRRIETETESETEAESDAEPNKNRRKHKKIASKFDITFTLGKRGINCDDETDDDGDEDEDECETDSNTTEDEDEDVSSASSSDSDDDDDSYATTNDGDDNESVVVDASNAATGRNRKGDSADNSKLVSTLREMRTECKTPLVSTCIRLCKSQMKRDERKQEKTATKQKQKNLRIMRHIMSDAKSMKEYDYYSKMEVEPQKALIKEMRRVKEVSQSEKPYSITLLESDIPITFKANAIKKIKLLKHMDPNNGEYYKIKSWVDAFMRIPFGQYKTLPIAMADGVDACHAFMETAYQTLDAAVYGLNDAKMQIMQMLGQLIVNPAAAGAAIAIHGPPGTGKTSLVKDGISKILDRPFTFIALGGATDSSFLEGHSYTYEGSLWGKIVQTVIDSKCMNPVIYFDELDKISDTPKGEEIIGILTHLIDSSQNDKFHDKYFADIDFDMSKCLFIFSYNDESKINPVLKDRMYRIETKGYSSNQKHIIVDKYLLPKIREQVKFTAEDIIITEQTVKHIIEKFCNREEGIRTLKRCLEILYTKANLYRLMRTGANIFEGEMNLAITFPLTITPSIADKMIKIPSSLNPSLAHLYC